MKDIVSVCGLCLDVEYIDIDILSIKDNDPAIKKKKKCSVNSGVGSFPLYSVKVYSYKLSLGVYAYK